MCFVLRYLCLLTVFLNCVIISCVWLQTCNCYMIIFICFVSCKALVYITGSSFKGFKIVLVCSEMNYRCCIAVTFFTVPCKVQLCIIRTRC